jgi:signal transduction histidine kinase
MVNAGEIRRVAAFSDLPDNQIDWFLGQAQEIFLKAGENFVRQGDPADWMFVLLDGVFQWRGEFGGDTVVLPAKAGDVTGVYPFSRMKQFTVTGRALTEGRLLRFPASLFPELVQKMPELTTRLVAMMSDRIREGTRIEQQRDRLVSLGKLAAGLAHELNNPSAAAARATSQLKVMLKKIKDVSFELGRRRPSDAQQLEIDRVEAFLMQTNISPLDTLSLSDLEDRLNTVLCSHGQDDAWQLSATLARCNMQPDALESLMASLDSATAHAAVVRIAASAESEILLNVIENGTLRISELVQTIKEYTYLDQAPMQDVDIVRSLETTLTMLNHELRNGITVRREYQPVPLLVDSFGSELNQIWTNLIQNAIDAMSGKGELRVRTSREEHYVVVEIGDNGPGIAPEVRSHIFEPFFTTKGVGEGTGLGLDTVQRIVRKHRGDIHLSSSPGDTRFQVWLPLAESASHHGTKP